MTQPTIPTTPPVLRYLNTPNLAQDVEVSGPVRTVTVDGRSGLHAESRHTRMAIRAHSLNEPVGSMVFWLLSLEDLDTVCHLEHIRCFDPHYAAYTLFSDNADIRAWTEATFALVWSSNWYPQFFAKFYQGNIYPEAYAPVHRGFVAAGHWHVVGRRWYHVALTWDKPSSSYRIYINGVCAAVSNRFRKLSAEKCGSTLYAGNTTFALSDLAFYAHQLSANELEHMYQESSTAPDANIDQALRRTYAGAGLPSLPWQPTAEWKCQLELTLDRPEHLNEFYVQGCQSAAEITPNGLEIATPPSFPDDQRPQFGSDSSSTDPITNGPVPSYMLMPTAERAEWPNRDRSQVYLWNRRYFEGDIVVELEFMPLQEQGLSLLMLQAAGMQREDVLIDDLPRQSGSMSTVCWENVRNYHWEFYRQLTDARNDVASHVLVKNPWLRPLHYTCQSTRLQVGVWHQLRFVQEGGCLRGAVDNELVIDARDLPSTGTGAVLNCGHVVIRAMLNTRMRYRNLRVFTRNGMN